MINIVRGLVVSRDHAEIIESRRPSKNRARRIDCRNVAVGPAQVTVVPSICVDISSHDRSKVIESGRAVGGTARALVLAAACAGSIERGKRTVWTA
jgi:hypothetical protein